MMSNSPPSPHVPSSRVLLVEGDDVLRATYERGLRKAALEVTTVADGSDTLSALGYDLLQGYALAWPSKELVLTGYRHAIWGWPP